MSSYTISSSDEEIINALTLAEGIRKEFVSNSSFENSCNVLYDGDSERTTSLTSSTNESSNFKGTFYHGNEVYDSFKFDAEVSIIF